MTSLTSYKIIDNKTKQSFNVNSENYEYFKIMTIGIKHRFSVEVIWDLMSCHCCGQGLIPFKKGVCICGMQVGSIQYVNDPEKFAKIHYSNRIANSASS